MFFSLFSTFCPAISSDTNCWQHVWRSLARQTDQTLSGMGSNWRTNCKKNEQFQMQILSSPRKIFIFEGNNSTKFSKGYSSIDFVHGSIWREWNALHVSRWTRIFKQLAAQILLTAPALKYLIGFSLLKDVLGARPHFTKQLFRRTLEPIKMNAIFLSNLGYSQSRREVLYKPGQVEPRIQIPLPASSE